MINLLPQTEQKEIRAGLGNTLLVRYVLLMICALAFLLVALAITYFSLNQVAKQADETKQANELKAVGFIETQAAATSLRNDLSSAQTLFDNEIRYSKVLTRLTGLLPTGTAISEFSIDDTSFSQPITLSVKVKNQTAAEQLQANFTSSPYITNASLGTISTNQEQGSYPYTAELLFTFNRSIGQ